MKVSTPAARCNHREAPSPPNSPAMVAPQPELLSLSGNPVAASVRKVSTIGDVDIDVGRHEATDPHVSAPRWVVELPANGSHHRALEPQERVHAEEAEGAHQQGGHEEPDEVDNRILRVALGRVEVRPEADEARGGVGVAAVAGGLEVGRIH